MNVKVLKQFLAHSKGSVNDTYDDWSVYYVFPASPQLNVMPMIK
jgi:hypothetical protein